MSRSSLAIIGRATSGLRSKTFVPSPGSARRSKSSGRGAWMSLYRVERRLWIAPHPNWRFGVIDSA
jgi:hypothetical protein